VEERQTGKRRITLALPDETIQRLNEVVKGTKVSVEDVVQQAVEAYLARPSTGPGPERLTPRQRQVLQLIAEGNKTKDIARKLDISVKTVEMHRTQLMETLDLHTIAELVRFAIRNGMIDA
jgi:DNA-binding NarL/FixJ family response regulator